MSRSVLGGGWPGAAVLARHLLDHDSLVAGKTVVDLGCGGAAAGRAGKQLDGPAKTREVKLVTVWTAEGRDAHGLPVRDPGSVTDLSRRRARLRHDELDDGHLDDLCEALRRHATTHHEAHNCLAYVTHHQARMRYPAFRGQGLCVSSGVVEAGYKVAIGARLTRAGMYWTVAGADAIIALRCCQLGGRFEDFRERRSARAHGEAA